LALARAMACLAASSPPPSSPAASPGTPPSLTPSSTRPSAPTTPAKRRRERHAATLCRLWRRTRWQTLAKQAVHALPVSEAAKLSEDVVPASSLRAEAPSFVPKVHFDDVAHFWSYNPVLPFSFGSFFSAPMAASTCQTSATGQTSMTPMTAPGFQSSPSCQTSPSGQTSLSGQTSPSCQTPPTCQTASAQTASTPLVSSSCQTASTPLVSSACQTASTPVVSSTCQTPSTCQTAPTPLVSSSCQASPSCQTPPSCQASPTCQTAATPQASFTCQTPPAGQASPTCQSDGFTGNALPFLQSVDDFMGVAMDELTHYLIFEAPRKRCMKRYRFRREKQSVLNARHPKRQKDELFVYG